MRRTLSIGVSFALALSAGAGLAGQQVQPAAALTTGVRFSADNLSTWQADGVVYALGQASGRVLAGGTFGQIKPPAGSSAAAQTRSALAVFDAETGAPDSCQFTVALSGGTPTVRAITTAADGKTVYVAGNFSNIAGTTVSRLAALDMSTCKVLPFRAPSISATVRALALSGNNLYFGGDFQTVGGQQRQRFAAVNATSGALLPWVANAELPGRAVAVSPDGAKVAIGGDFFSVNGESSHSIAVVDGTTGANLRTYTNFIDQTSVTKSITSDGNAFYVGNEGTGGGVFDGGFKIDWGTLDQVWRNNCLGATQASVVDNGTLYEASHHHNCETIGAFQDGKRNFFTAASTSEPKLLQWFPTANDGIGEGIGPRALVIATGRTTGKRYLWSGGEFTRINGNAQQGLTRFGPDDVGAPPVPVASAQPVSSGAIQVRLRTVVDPDDGALTYRIYRNGATTPIWTGTASSLWWSRPQITFTDSTVTAGTSYSYRVTASDGTNTSVLSTATSARAASPRSDYAGQVAADGAQLYWRYDETSGEWAQDSSGSAKGLNGIYSTVSRGAAGAIAGDTSASAGFDGTDSFVWSDQLEQAPSVYSVETWFKTTTTSGGKIVGYGNGRPRTDNGDFQNSSSYDRHIYMQDDGHLRFGAYNGSATTLSTPKAYNDGNWHQVVATQGPTGMTFYVDGARVARNSTSEAQPYLGTWRVGGDYLGGWPGAPSSQFFQGSIDDTSVYPTVLSAAQVTNHYTLAGGTVPVRVAPSDAYGAAVYTDQPDLYWRLDETSGSDAADSSPEGASSGTYGPSVQLGQPRLTATGTAVGVTGTGDSLVAEKSSHPSSAQFSLEAWIKTSTKTGGKIVGFEDVATGFGNNYDKQVYMTNDGRLAFGVYDAGFHLAQSQASFNDGVKHHVVATQGADGMALYVDGVKVGSDSQVANQSFDGFWRVGSGNLSNWPDQPATFEFTGTVDEVAVYPSALTPAQVQAHLSVGTRDNQAPTAPSDVAATVRDDSALVTWSASSDDDRVAGYRVYRGRSAGFTPDSTSLVGEVSTPGFTEPLPAVGTSYYKVVALDPAGNLSPASSAASITVADLSAPTAPASLRVSTSGTTNALDWDAASDDVAVTGYQVYRGTTSDVAVDASTKVADVTSGTSYADTGLKPGSYYYRVTAVDAAGNVGPATPAVVGTVAAPVVDPVVKTVLPTADAMVAAAAASTNYGTTTALASRGGTGTSPSWSYLAFDLPAAPSGTVLTGATLQVRTTSDAAAGSTDSHSVKLLSSGSWTESAVTWNNRPTALGDELGAISAPSAISTSYTAKLDASVLAAKTGTSTTLVLSSTGTDNVRLWSKEASSAYRPVLTLTYTAR